jgi:maleate cis-trans isomerase
MEGELLAWLPPGSTCQTVRIPRGPGLLTDETLPAYLASAVELSRSFADMGIDVLAYGCTAAGFIMGPAGDAEIARRLHETTGRPVVTTARSMVKALQRAGARRIALLTPYQDDVNDRLKAFLADGDITVSSFDSFYAADVHALGMITSAQVTERARALHAKAPVDALFIACSQLPTLDAVGVLSQHDQPVLSSIQVTAEACRFSAQPRQSSSQPFSQEPRA